MGEQHAEKADEPRELQPQQEERQGGKTSVDGVITGDPDLSRNVEHLEKLEGRAGNEGTEEGITKLDFGVGDVDVDEGEQADDEEERKSFHERCQNMVEQIELVDGRTDEQGDAGIADHKDGNDEDQGQIVGELAVIGSLAFDVPDVVEVVFDPENEAHYRVEHEDDAHADEDAALGIFERRVGKFESFGENGFLPGKVFEEFALDDVLEAKASGNGEKDGQNGNDGQKSAVGQGRSARTDVELDEVADGENKDADKIENPGTSPVGVLFGDAPDVLADELDELADESPCFLDHIGIVVCRSGFSAETFSRRSSAGDFVLSSDAHFHIF